jgi:hypothetical protein
MDEGRVGDPVEDVACVAVPRVEMEERRCICERGPDIPASFLRDREIQRRGVVGWVELERFSEEALRSPPAAVVQFHSAGGVIANSLVGS